MTGNGEETTLTAARGESDTAAIRNTSALCQAVPLHNIEIIIITLLINLDGEFFNLYMLYKICK